MNKSYIIWGLVGLAVFVFLIMTIHSKPTSDPTVPATVVAHEEVPIYPCDGEKCP